MSSYSVTIVNFFFEGVAPIIRDRKKLKQFIISIFEIEKRKLGAMNYIFSTDTVVHSINKKYLNHDILTDIVTFELSEKGESIVGEVYISVERVRENAFEHGVSFANELHRVMFHGVLHLCGFRDKTPFEIKKMREKENFYLKKYFGQCFT